MSLSKCIDAMKPLKEQSLTGNNEKKGGSVSVDAIALILKYFSITELMSFRCISHSWKEAAEMVLRSFQVFHIAEQESWLSQQKLCHGNRRCHQPDKNCFIPSKAFRSNLQAEALQRLLSGVRAIHFLESVSEYQEDILRLWADQIECLTCHGRRTLAKIVMPNLVHIYLDLESIDFAESLITNSPNLQIIRIGSFRSDIDHTYENFLKSLRSGLKEFHIDDWPKDPEYQALFIISSPAMETVTSMKIPIGYPETNDYERSGYRVRPAPLLKKLHIFGTDYEDPPPYIWQFLEGCNPLLEDLNLNFQFLVSDLELGTLSHFTNLKKLELRIDMRVGAFETLTKLLVDQHPNLQLFKSGEIFFGFEDNDDEPDYSSLQEAVLLWAQLKSLTHFTLHLGLIWKPSTIESLEDQFRAHRQLFTNIPIETLDFY